MALSGTYYNHTWAATTTTTSSTNTMWIEGCHFHSDYLQNDYIQYKPKVTIGRTKKLTFYEELCKETEEWLKDAI